MAPAEPKEPKKRGPKPGGRKGGMPKGYKTAKVISKEEAKDLLRDMVIAELRPIVRATIKAATGIDHFMLRDPLTGQFKRLTDPDEIEAALNHPDAEEGSTYWIYTKDPNTQAAADLFNRVIGKPIEEVKVEGAISVVRWAGE